MILNIVTTAYFLSMIVMAFWTNVKPFYFNENWNKTQVSPPRENASYKASKQEFESFDIIVVINLVMASIFGKWRS